MSVIEKQAATITAGAWQSDPIHSSLGFEVKYLGAARFRGELSDFDGVLNVGDDGISLVGAGRVASVRTKDENLDAHLQSPDFFDAERHPEIAFRSTDVKLGADGEATIAGELTIKGVTKPVILHGTASEPVVDYADKTKVAIDLETTIDRTEFGVSWNAPLPGGDLALANDVTLSAQLLFVKGDE
jgi:polyisoprenoid-binding protein YceI